ncbi:MAG: response regulator [Clostridiales bacterium]|nr:response regulator [Clostridiales bacterium]
MIKKFKNLTVGTRLILSFSAVIIVFVASFVFAATSYAALDRLHRHRFDHIGASERALLEFHQQFTELRLRIRLTFLSEDWLNSAEESDWRDAEQQLGMVYRNLHSLSNRFIELVGENPLLAAEDEQIRVDTIGEMMSYVSIIYGIFGEEFDSNFRFELDSESLATIDRTATLFSSSIEESLLTLRNFVDTTNDAIIHSIDYTVIRTLWAISAVILAAIVAAVMLAYLMIKAVINMGIEKTREAEELNRALIEAEPFSVMIWLVQENNDLLAIDCNKQTLELFGLDDKEEFLLRFDEFSPEFQPCGLSTLEKQKITEEAVLRDGVSRFEWTHLRADGSEFPTDVTLVRQQFQGNTLIFSYCVDISELRNAIAKEQEEISRRQTAEEESRAKTKFLARMSHEIRTPLNAVMGLTEIQLQKENHPQDTEDAFLRIYNSSSLLLAIINDILDLSKVEAGKMEIVEATYEVASLIVDTVQLNLMHIGSKRIDFKLNVDENLPSHLLGDEMRIKQVLNNILSNAFKYTYAGFVHLSIEFQDEAEGGPAAIFRVEDSGQGMSQEQIDGLFEIEFTRFNMQTNRAIEGSGLGMNIAKQLLDMMGGEIEVISKPSKGSVFTVRIPQKPRSDAKIGAAVAKNLENLEITQKELKRINKFKRLPMPYGRVLIVDDVESNLFVAKGLLLPYKLSIETVDSGIEAIRKVEDGRVYDIIFMDHMMPEMDGMEAVKIIREMGYTHPIVALTANTVRGQADVFLQNGFDGFISKPIDVNYLNSYLLRFVRDAHPDKAHDDSVSDFAEMKIAPGQIRDAFLSDAKRVLNVLEPLEEQLYSDALKSYITHTHGIKSALAEIGEGDLSEQAMLLENSGKAIRDETANFIDGLKELIAEFGAQKEAVCDSEEDAEAVQGNLLKIAESLDDFDIETAETALKELQNMNCSQKTLALTESIAGHMLLGDYDEGARIARNWG